MSGMTGFARKRLQSKHFFNDAVDGRSAPQNPIFFCTRAFSQPSRARGEYDMKDKMKKKPIR
jgi:hypothetical protein